MSSAFSLPSIHEMFPEHLTHRSPYSPEQRISSPVRAPHRAYSTNSQVPRPYASSSAHALRSSVGIHVTPPRDPRSSRSFDADNSTTRSPRPASDPGHRMRTDPLHYSFNVLRSDPSNSSLEHIASSASYPHKSSNNNNNSSSNSNHSNHSSNNNPVHHHHVAPTSTPAFRVTVPPRSSSLGHCDMTSSPSSSSSSPGERHSERTSESSKVYTATISFPSDGTPPRGPTSLTSGGAGEPRVSDVNGAVSDDGEPSSHTTNTAGKKHICPTCSKRFNRPSSLRIHVNTHTGATPFRCPFPNCGREFNVNSNMRRHYRNHTSPGLSRAQPVEPRRRRRRGAHDSNLVFVTGGPPGQPQPHSFSDLEYHHHHHHQDFMHHVPGTPESSISDESEDDHHHPSMTDYHRRRYSDDYHIRHLPLSHSRAPFTHREDAIQVGFPTRESHLRSSTPMSIVSSSDPDSRSGTPNSPNSSADHKYSPSVPFLRSVLVTDSSVSTALRPAFT